MKHLHRLPSQYRDNRIKVVVVGCGGTGSAFLMGLPYLHQALKVWGHPDGLEVVAIDPDVVSPTNCVRQPFAESDIGLPKAEVLIGRINQFWGLNWKAEIRAYKKTSDLFRHGGSNIIVGCVDTRKARREILGSGGSGYWLDCGNSSGSGQFILGQFQSPGKRSDDPLRLPLVSELFPEIVAEEAGEDDLPSCSAIEALDRQMPFVNQTLANAGLAMLTRLFRTGTIAHHGGFYNSETGAIVPLKVNPEEWEKRRSLESKSVARGKRRSVNHRKRAAEAQAALAGA